MSVPAEVLQPMLKPLPLLGHLPAFSQNPLAFLTECAESGERTIPLRFLHKRAIVLTDADEIERVLVTDHALFRKPDWLRTPAVRRLLGESLVLSEGEEWKKPREQSQPAFHTRLLPGYAETISRLTQRRMENWRVGQVLDTGHEMTLLTLEIIVEALFKVEIGSRAEGIEAAMNILMARFGSKRSLYGMIPWPPSFQERKAVAQINRAVDSLIQRYRETHLFTLSTTAERGPDTDLVSRLGCPYAGKDTPLLSLREHLKTFLAAGYESSALSLSWTLHLLATHSDASQRLTRELREVLEGRPPQMADLPRLPYTRAVMKEGLRLYPPLWMIGRQAQTALELGGQPVSAGTLVMTSPWLMHRHPRYFSCAAQFRPERWLSGETDTLPHYAFFPFGGGPRVCIGQGFAMMELALVLAAILQRFSLQNVADPGLQPWATMMLRSSSPILLRLGSPPDGETISHAHP